MSQIQQNPPQWQPTNPPAPPAPPPYAPEKPKSWFARHKLLAAFLAIVALIVISMAMGGDDPSTTPSSGPAASAPADGGNAEEAPAQEAPAVAKIGTKVRDGQFEFVVTGVKSGGTQIGDSTFGEKAQGVFQLVSVTVTNIGDKPQTMLDSVQKVKDAQGREFSPNSMASISLDGTDSIWLEEVNPGNTVKGTLVYDMPKGSAPVSIELHDSMFSGGVTVSLK